MKILSPKPGFWDAPSGAFAAGIACFVAVALALVSQYVFDMQPCPWCVLQRAVFVLAGLVCLALGFVKNKAAQAVIAGTGSVLAVCGMACAVWQHFQAAASSSCNLTLADKIISKWTHLSEIAPFVFEAHSSCADAQVNLLGVPYAFWSLAVFAALAVFLIKKTAQALR